MQPFLTQYQSANLSDEQIIDNFVVRTKEFARVMADIRTTDKNSSFQHYVFVGRRGSGKSTLLRRIQAEVATDPELNAQFIATNLSEEQAGIYKLYDLWDYVIRDLRAKGFDLPEIDWQEYQDDLKEYTKVLYRAIHEFLQQQDKRLILLVDNIDRIFKNIGKDASLLREQLMNFNDVRIIGGSTVMAEDFWRYDMPFYQFFSIKRLEPLSMEEIKMLLEHWAAVRRNPEIAKFVERHPGKIQAVRMLTDGTPRTMQLFVDMLIARDEQQGFEHLQSLVDSATPVFQERLAQLSHQQQKIVTELSLFWEAASVEQLVPVCKMTGKNISAQMHQLLGSQIVEKISGTSKNNLYRIKDRPFGYWVLLTQGSSVEKEAAKEFFYSLQNYYDIYDEFGNPIVRPPMPASRSFRHLGQYASDHEEVYIAGPQARNQSLFVPTTQWGDAHEEAITIYHSNSDRNLALSKIGEALEFCSDEFPLLAIQNILQLWAGEIEEFAKNVHPILQEIIESRADLIPAYISELLVHKQLQLVIQMIEQYPPSYKENTALLPYLYATLILNGKQHSRLLRMPPELEKIVSDIVAKVKERQEFYYGK